MSVVFLFKCLDNSKKNITIYSSVAVCNEKRSEFRDSNLFETSNDKGVIE